MTRGTMRTLVLVAIAVGALLAFHTEDDEHVDSAAGRARSSTSESASAPTTVHTASNGGAANDDNWPQWRGPGGLGLSVEAGISTSWSEAENIIWKTPIEGRGHSSPIVWGDRIFLTTAIEGGVIPAAQAPIHYMQGQVFKHPQSVGSDHSHTLKVLAIDRHSGEPLWSEVAYEGQVYDDRHQASSYASPTMVTDGELVYAYFGSQGVYAYDFDGEPVWRADLGNIATMGVGLGTSPVLFEGLLIINADEDEGEKSFIVALDKKTGDEIWKKPRPVEVSWSTPLLIEDNSGRTQLLTSGNEHLISYDPATGEELWRLDGLLNNAIHAPLYNGELVFMTAGYPRSVIKAIRLVDGPDGPAAEFVWEYKKGAAYVSSNIVYGDYLYVTNDKGIITCLDAGTGEIVYEGGRIPVPASMLMSSLLVVDGKILLSTPEGDTFFIRTGPEFEVVSSSSIDEPIAATPAIVDGKIYLRGTGHLYAIGDDTP